ncbi:adenosine deaminase [Luteolibacter ambystomatis]|uniref:adenosine deaminase n=1 Tax=Luteolibacter ambystomatis TaxID=2824561 RepID=A0A975J0Q0_9BACT|nr:adenosine deaminase [Luteolibacter ambystomatis]QUE51854.1 adenosine deaminase [Luteolibacter ambystomatis]
MIEHRYPELFPTAPMPSGKELVNALDFTRIPKVLLHEHLDGGLRPQTILELAKSHRYTGLPTEDAGELAAWFHRGAQRGNLPEYLEGFAHTIGVMQERDALERVAFEFIEDMHRDGVIYAEVRFAPVFHTGHGLSQDEVVEAVLEGLDRGGRQYGVKWGLILCAMRDRTDSLEAAELAIRWRDKGVVGFDLAGGEAGHPPKKHMAAFEAIRRANFHITIHAGEAFGLESIWQAIQWCGAHRLGHGTRLRNDIEVQPDGSLKLGPLAQFVLDRRIPIEMCLLSNVHTGATPSLEEHPFPLFHRAGFRACLNTDDRLMSDTSMTKEFETATTTFGLDLVDLEKITMNAMKSAFAPHHERVEVIHKRLLPSYATLFAELTERAFAENLRKSSQG